ncbi:hypothetical protein FHL15_002077 [Xylaria flabelliformis]|uniref:Methyltransferase domain-containing protein n=1 Tax=Xylaria flabelliformis TaxID=2512241 RepID=A0A553IAR1_9PEZI|nr:hypothetical protein FHL15_002077 [Xylaria flabelliformis]
MGIYYLNNGEEGWEAGRLNWSHHEMVMPLVGNTLLPGEIKEQLESEPSPAIADVCTGTGVWAVSVAQELPNAQIRGFDIDKSKFMTNLPSQVELQYGDILSPFPSEFLGKFDLVHARFLVAILRKEDWVPIARNLMTLLRPGGWILWEESGPFAFRVLPISPGWMRMPETLPKHLEDAGFVDLKTKDYHTSPHEKLDVATKESMLRLAYQSFLGMVASGTMEEMKTEAQAKLAVDEIRKEFEQGALCFWTLNRVWGKRPN